MTATDNLPTTGGTDSATPSTDLDNPANWDYFDPDEEKQDTEAPKEATGTAVENDEDEQQPAQESDDEQQEQPTAETEEAQPAKEAKPELVLSEDIKVKMPNGETLDLKELGNGYMRQSDFTRKRQQDAQRATYIQGVSEKIERFLAAQIPPPPEPALAYENPAAYAAQLAQHDASKRQWQQVLEASNEAREAVQSFTQEQRQEVLLAEAARLKERIPEMATEKGREEFTKKALEVANLAGVSEEELRSFTDHRYFVVLKYAIQGLAAEKAKAIAKQKTASAPPVAPAKRQAPQSSAAIKNGEAMKRLARSGSIQDAMNVDFD
jgi:hypothetical protein